MAVVRRPGTRTWLATLGALLGLLIAAGPAGATLPQQTGSVDVLAGQFGARVVGTAGFTGSHPYAVAGIGDMFGDGFSDVAVTPSHGTLPVDVVRGRTSNADIAFGALGSGGFEIVDSANSRAGVTIARAGDVNGDGIPDVLVSEPFASPGGRASAGSVFVVFGKRDTNTIDLANLGNGGFRIDGALAGDQIGYNGSNGGWALAGGQDLNGDGKSDILIGATVDAGSRPAWVVFGKPSSSPVDLATLAADGNGYEIDPPAGKTFGSYGTGAGIDLALVADLNGDGRGEAVLGVPGAGTTYVAFGKASTSPLNLASLGSGGWTITGSFSQTAGSTCDFNGDGRPDVLVGDQSGSLGRNSNGRTWVIYGHAAGNVDLTALTAAQGIRIDGATSFEYASESALSGVGDVNGSGRCAIVIGAYQANNNDGKAYVVYGRPTGATEFDLAGLTAADGYVVTHAGQFASLGHGGDAAGDFNADGRPDVITDAPFAPDFLHQAGEADIIYGFGAPAIRYGSINATVGTEITPLVPAVQKTGAASFAISPGLPAGLSFDPSTGAISGTPAAAQPATSYTVTMTDLAGTVSATIALAVAAQPPPDRQQADSIQVQKIEQQLSLRPDQTVTATQDCPAAAPIATDGSVRIDHVDQGTGYLTSVDVLESRSVVAGRWVARVHNLASGDAQAKLFVVCVANRTTPDSHALRFGGRVTTTVTWDVGSHQAILACPAGRIPVAPGFDFVSGSGWWYRSVQSGSSWIFGAHVTSPAAVELSIRCLATRVGAAQHQSHRLLFGFPVRAPGLAAPSGTSAYVLACRDHAKAIVGGFDLGPGIRTFGNDPQPKSRVFQLANLGLQPSTAHLAAICLTVRTSGRVGG